MHPIHHTGFIHNPHYIYNWGFRLVFSEDGAAPTLLGMFQIPLLTGDTIGLRCEDNILVCDITLPVLV